MSCLYFVQWLRTNGGLVITLSQTTLHYTKDVLPKTRPRVHPWYAVIVPTSWERASSATFLLRPYPGTDMSVFVIPFQPLCSGKRCRLETYVLTLRVTKTLETLLCTAVLQFLDFAGRVSVSWEWSNVSSHHRRRVSRYLRVTQTNDTVPHSWSTTVTTPVTSTGLPQTVLI